MPHVLEDLTNFLRQAGPGFLVKLGTAVSILFSSVLLARGASRLVRKALEGSGASAFSTVIAGGIKTALAGIGIVMALDQLGLDVSTLLAGAGVVGLAIGFGSQAIVKDVVSGVFLVVDGALKPGDRVKIGDSKGVVENIGLRMTEIRADDGQVFYVSNGSIGVVANESRDWALVSVDVKVDHQAELGACLAELQRVASATATELGSLVIGDAEAQGVADLDAEGATVRVVLKVKPEAKASAAMLLRKHVREDYYGRRPPPPEPAKADA